MESWILLVIVVIAFVGLSALGAAVKQRQDEARGRQLTEREQIADVETRTQIDLFGGWRR